MNAIREDPVRRGLLFAGTEKTAYVSFDDGDDWQSLRNDLPVTSIRDLVVHGDDLIAGTHGRSFWILDDVAPLREWAARRVPAASAHLYAPARTYRVRRDTYTDTPLPPDEPVGENPPDGAIVDYTLPAGSTGRVTIAIDDDRGRRIRTFASDDPDEAIDPEIDVPTYWVRPTRRPSALPGTHRFVWDLHETAPPAFEHTYPISAIVHDTPRDSGRRARHAGNVHGPPHRRRSHVFATSRRRDGSARDGSAQRDRRAVRPRVAHRGRDDAHVRPRLARTKDAATAKRYRALNGQLAAMLDLVEGGDAAPTANLDSTAGALIGGLARGGRTPLTLQGEDEP